MRKQMAGKCIPFTPSNQKSSIWHSGYSTNNKDRPSKLTSTKSKYQDIKSSLVKLRQIESEDKVQTQLRMIKENENSGQSKN